MQNLQDSVGYVVTLILVTHIVSFKYFQYFVFLNS